MLIRLFCAFWILFSATAHAEPVCDPNYLKYYRSINARYEKGVLFRVEKCGRPISYVLGTFHSDHRKVKEIGDEVSPILGEVEVAAFEIVADKAAQSNIATSLTLRPDQPDLPALIGDERYAKVKAQLGKTLFIPEDVLPRYKPWAVAVMMQYPPDDTDGIVLDQYLQKMAAGRGLHVVGLETVQDQFRVFEKLSLAEQLSFLDESLSEIDQVEEMNEKLKNLYLNYDLRGIAALSDDTFQHMSEHDDKLADYLSNSLIVKRNRAMATRLQKQLAKPTLVAVGALHLLGDEGILANLERQGYVITPVHLDEIDTGN